MSRHRAILSILLALAVLHCLPSGAASQRHSPAHCERLLAAIRDSREVDTFRLEPLYGPESRDDCRLGGSPAHRLSSRPDSLQCASLYGLLTRACFDSCGETTWGVFRARYGLRFHDRTPPFDVMVSDDFKTCHFARGDSMMRDAVLYTDCMAESLKLVLVDVFSSAGVGQ
jgi:hypothetical protein